MQAEFDCAAASVAVPFTKVKFRSALISLPRRYSHARSTATCQWSVASGAFADVLPVGGGSKPTLLSATSVYDVTCMHASQPGYQK